MATYTEKRLAALQQLPSSIGDLYTASGVTCILKTILLKNTNATAETGSISLYDGVNTMEFFDFDLGPGEAFEWYGSVPLNASDKIKGVTTTAAMVNCYLGGVEKV